MSFYYSRAGKYKKPPKHYHIMYYPPAAGDTDEYGFFCDMEDIPPMHTYAHTKYFPTKKDIYNILPQSHDPYICDIQESLEEYRTEEMNNETRNDIAKRLQIYMHIGVGCIFCATSWILFFQNN